MSADTLTDAHWALLRRCDNARLVFGSLSIADQDAVGHLRAHGYLDQVAYPGITPAGREALARHESEVSA